MHKIIKFLIIILILLSFSGFTINAVEIPEKSLEPIELPISFDYRNINGIDYTTPVKNQAPAPTCEAYALIAALETIIQYQTNESFEPDLSECHLYFYAGGTYESGYVNLIDAANYLVNIGVPDEGCYPDPHRPYDYPFTSLDDWENRTVKINDWGWVENNPESIKNALIEHGPLIFCAHFWKDFYYYKSGVYRHRWGAVAGGHVMTIVGYDDNEQCWICKNSAGTNWGEDGWWKMAYDAEMITGNWYRRQDENCTGIMYINGSYGNLHPDVPKVQIQKPLIYKTYFNGIEFSTLFKKLNMFQRAAARIIGDLTIQVSSDNTNHVEFYIDDELKYTDYEAPFSWDLDTNIGPHTLMTIAYNDNSKSMDIIDIHKIL